MHVMKVEDKVYLSLRQLNFVAGMCFEVIGTMLGVIIYTVCYLGFVENEEDSCNGGTRISDPNKVRMPR